MGRPKVQAFSCANNQVSEAITTNRVLELFQMLTLPREALVHIIKDEVCPQGRYPYQQVLKKWPPWRVRGSFLPAHTYAFLDLHGFLPRLSFLSGHLSSGEITRPEELRDDDIIMSFDKTVESNGIWFPTDFRREATHEACHIRLSAVKVFVR